MCIRTVPKIRQNFTIFAKCIDFFGASYENNSVPKEKGVLLKRGYHEKII